MRAFLLLRWVYDAIVIDAVWTRRGFRPQRARLTTPASSHIAGIALIALLVALTVMQIGLALALPQWDKWVQREKELELIWRGEQYVQAIMYYFHRFGTYPPSIDLLVQQHFLRRAYKDPFSPDGSWQILYQVDLQMPVRQRKSVQRRPPGSKAPKVLKGGIVGVVSKDPGESIVIYKGRNRHSDWQFVYIPRQMRRRQLRRPRRPPVRQQQERDRIWR